MPNTVIQLKKSATPASVPSGLANGELALNFADGILYYKSANGSIAAISGSGAGGGSNYGIINANGTLLLAGAFGDAFSILPGDFVTVVGDAINDRVTIGANVKPVFDKANNALANTSGVSFAGDLTIPGKLYITNENADALRTRFISGKASGSTANGSLYLNYDYNDPVRVGSGTVRTDFYVANGRIGIGTSTPTANLDVTTNGSAGFRVFKDYLTYVAGPGGTSYRWDNDGLALGTNSGPTYRLYVDSTGYFGGRLYLQSSIDFTTAGGEAAKISSPSFDVLTFSNSGGERLRINSLGNVGIGTSSPSSKLQVNGTVTIANTGPVESFRSGANTITLNMYNEANGTLSWEGSAGQLFSITNDLSGSLFTVNDVSGIPSIEVDALGNVDLAPFGGNVGIGTSNPVYKLDVQGDARITGNLTLGDATTDTITVNAANFNLANNVSFDSGTLFIDAQNNRVGVGITNPQHSLSVNGSIHLTTGDGDRIWSGSNNLRLGSYPQLAVSDTLQISGGQQSIVFGGTGAYATIGSNVPWDFVKGTTPQGIRIHGTFTNVSNYERLNISANSTAAYIRTENAGTGVARPLYLGANNQTVVSINADKSVGVKQTLTGRSSIDHVTYSIFEAGVDAVYLCNNYNRSGPGYPPDTIYIGGLASDNFSRDLFKISSTNVITTGALFQVVRPAVDPTVMGAGALQISRGLGTNSLSIGTSANDQYAWLQYSLDYVAKNIVLSPVGGNVGIGTTSPSARLHANTSAGTVAQFTGGSDSGVIFAAGGLVGFTDPAGNNGFIFNSTSNYAYAQTNGSERMRITSGGNLGIGTSAPSSTLHVIGTANITSSVTASDYNSSTTGYKISGTQVLYYSGGVTYLNDLGGGIGLRTASTTRLFIDTSGNVGINTSSPKALLDVKPLSSSNTFSIVLTTGQIVNGFSSLRYTTSYAHNDLLLGNFQDDGGRSQTAISFGYTGDPARKLHIGSANSATFDSNASFVPAVTVTSGGRLGVGTTSPATTLHVIGTANVSSTIYTRDIEAPFYSLYNEGAGAYVGIKGNYLRFGGVSEFMRIANTSGYVGIGTTAPAYRLDVTPTSNEVGLHLAPTTGYDTGFYITSHANNDTVIGSGAAYVSAQFVAKASSAEIIDLYNGGYYFYGDTGLTPGSVYSPTMRMILDSSGRLGIGTGSPSARLHVNNGNFLLNKQYVGGESQAALTVLHSNVAHQGISYDVAVFQSDDAPGLRIVETNTVGNFNRTAELTLCAGDGYANNFAPASVIGSNAALIFATGRAVGSYAYATTGERMRITSDGNVGIGTTAPQTLLDVAGSDNNGIQYRTATRWISIGSYGGLSTVASGSGTEMVFSVGSERMRIDANGNIGIGTTTPTAVGSSATLSINSATAGASGVLVHQYNGSQIARSGVLSGYYTVQDLGSTNGLMIDEQSALPILFRTNATERMRITANGNVGIGTTAPGGKLTVAQPSGTYTSSAPFFSSLYDNTQHFNIYMDGNWNTHLSSIQVSTNQSALAFDTNGSERMRIDSSGNVGIGTTSPTYKLDVVGDVRANSFISGNSSIFTNTVITATTTDQIVDSFTTSTWRSAQYNITMTSGTDYHTTQISLIHDGTNAYITEYGTLSTANNLGTFSATVSGSTVRLNVVPTFANTSINMLRTTNK